MKMIKKVIRKMIKVINHEKYILHIHSIHVVTLLVYLNDASIKGAKDAKIAKRDSATGN